MKNFSLVLGGGAARGIAHIGVIRRLEELDMEPTAIVGTSIGALVGACYACGYTSSEMSEIAHDVPFLKLLDIDMKTGSLKGDKLMKYLEKYFGEKTFRDTDIPLIIIATDIDTGEEYIFREGKIIDAIRASIGIPGIFRPYKYDGRMLVDGGLVANLAIEEAPSDSPVIAVSVQIELSKVKRSPRGLIFPNGTPVTHAYGMIRKTLAIMMARNENASLALHNNTLLIRPGRPEIEYYDFRKVDALIEAGYIASEPISSFLI